MSAFVIDPALLWDDEKSTITPTYRMKFEDCMSLFAESQGQFYKVRESMGPVTCFEDDRGPLERELRP
jgi:hypothetical protein